MRTFQNPEEGIFYTPYVILDSVDGPSHNLLSIKMPEHLRFSLFAYTAISHETFHSYFSQIEIPKTIEYTFQKPLNLYCAPKDEYRIKLYEEICIELFDFSFSFLQDFDLYLEEEWKYFAKQNEYMVKEEIAPQYIIHFVIRTFAAKLYIIFKEGEYKCNELAAIRSQLRKYLREHLEKINLILKSNGGNGLKPVAIGENLHKIQHDVTAMSEVMDSIFTFCFGIEKKFEKIIDNMKKYNISQSTKAQVDKILNGEVLNESLKYPHLIIHSVFRNFRKSKNKKSEDEAQITIALILSVWNSKNIDNNA